MVDCIGDFSGSVIVQVREGYFVLSSDGMSEDNFADVVELVPVLIEVTQVPIKGLELGSSWDSNVEGFAREEGLQVKEVVIVFVDDI